MQAKKRIKTKRACDYCRNHKLKCDFSTEQNGETPICKHCEDYGITCVISDRPKPSTNGSVGSASGSNSRSDAPFIKRWHRKHSVALTEPRYSGPTSLSQLVSAVTRKWPSRANQVLSLMDSRYGHQRVEGVSGGPFLMLPQVRYPPEQIESKEAEEARLDIQTKKDLLRKYQRFVAPIFAILSDEESTAAVDLSVADQPISSLSNLGLALLTVAAMTRDTQIETRMALLYHLRGRPQVDVSSSLETLQYLLLLSANIELLSPDTNNSSGMSLNLTGLVTRMAQDLGLHRKISQLDIPDQHLSKRARIWAACIVQDRWYAMSYGQPCLIHLEDCDAPGPSPYHDNEAESRQKLGNARPYEVHVEHTKLSNLIGRLLRLVFTPTGLQHTSVEDLEKLKEDLDQWDLNLPKSLQCSGRLEKDANIGAGFLQLMKVGIDFIFYRSALVNTYNTSKNKAMSPPIVWEKLVKRSAESIEWVSTKSGTSVLDCWSVAMYALIQCCLVQFYAAISGEDPKPLRQARKCLHDWSNSIETQSHGYYDPQEGDTILPSSTTTAAQSSNPNAKGKKSLTLRTKAYTLIAMLTGIAEHHIANRPNTTTSNSIQDSSPNNVNLPKVSTTMSNSRVQNSVPPAVTAQQPLPPQQTASNSNYRFDSVLNPSNGKGSYLSQGASTSAYPAMPVAATIHSSQKHQHQQQQQQHVLQPPYAPPPPQHQQHLLSSIPNPAYSSMSSSHHPTDVLTGDIEQIDLITLQRWADELMRNPPNLDMRSYPQEFHLNPHPQPQSHLPPQPPPPPPPQQQHY